MLFANLSLVILWLEREKLDPIILEDPVRSNSVWLLDKPSGRRPKIINVKCLTLSIINRPCLTLGKGQFSQI